MRDEELRRQSIAVVQAHIAAINSWDIAAMEALLAEDTVMEMPFAPDGFDRRIEGREKVLAWVRVVASIIASENLHELVLDTLQSDPGQVVGTYRSDMQINGNTYRNQYIARWTVREGKLSYFGEYFDPVRLIVATGGRVEPGRFETG